MDPRHPQLRAFLAELRAAPGDRATAAALADWLADERVGLGGLAELYAGGPPGHDDGIPQGVLAECLIALGLEGGALSVEACRLEDYKGRRDGPPLAVGPPGDSRLSSVLLSDVLRRGDPYPYLWLNGVPPARWRQAMAAVRAALGLEAPDAVKFTPQLRVLAAEEVARAGRDLRRRVLALPAFGALRFGRSAVLYERERAEAGLAALLPRVFRPGGLRPDLRWSWYRAPGPSGWGSMVFSQTLRAADLVAVDAEAYRADPRPRGNPMPEGEGPPRGTMNIGTRTYRASGWKIERGDDPAPGR